MLSTIIITAVIVSLIVAVISKGGLSEGDRLTLSRIEAKADRLLEAAGINFEEEIAVETTRLILANKEDWTEAIKYYRRQAGVSLKEAKNYVDNLAEQIALGECRYVPVALGRKGDEASNLNPYG